LLQICQPLLHEFYDLITNAAGPIVELKRRSGKETASGENFPLAIGQPVLAERSKAIESPEPIGWADNFLDEDFASCINYGALQVFFGAEMGE
jgi:hypothetical protein